MKMDTIYKIINSALGIPAKTSLLPSSGTLVMGEPDNSNLMPMPENQQSETSSGNSFVSGNAEKPESEGIRKPSEAGIKLDTPKISNSEVRLKIDFSDNGLIQGFIMSEILAPPKAMKRRGNTIWNSRF